MHTTRALKLRDNPPRTSTADIRSLHGNILELAEDGAAVGTVEAVERHQTSKGEVLFGLGAIDREHFAFLVLDFLFTAQ